MEKQPLYQKIVEDIKAKIDSKELKLGDQVPTELEISKQYNVSRITSKRALTELENQNLIERIQGKGSFVKKRAQNAPKVILFILPFPDSPGLGDYTQGISRFIEKTNYSIQIQTNSFLNNLDFKDCLSQFSGLILYPEFGTSHIDLLYSLYLERFPTLILDKKVEGIPFISVTSDNSQGGYLATKFLINNGHKKIVFYANKNSTISSTVHERYLGYLKAIHEAQLVFQSQEWNDREINNEMTFQHYKKEGITGFVVENDITAIYLMKEMRKQGYHVPYDFSIIGFDNIQAASLIDPALTTISQNFEEIGYQAAKKLVDLIEGKEESAKSTIVPVELVIRESTLVKY